MKILVTGGAGYIGSHTVVELIHHGYEVVIVDNLCNAKEEVIQRIESIVGKKIPFYREDVCDKKALRKIFAENKIDAVIHFAGLKAVGESVEKPLLYYRNNIDSTLTLCEVMNEFSIKKIIFSSSATVYGCKNPIPYVESMETGSTSNPYGTTKLYIEGILKDLHVADSDWSVILLRYFNPVGAHESGLLGDDPNGIPNNLMPYIVRVATGELEVLSIFGDDYDTIDGTCVRDYIHVVDLAKGHVMALDKLFSENKVNVYNLGSGKGYSVKQLVDAFENYNHVTLNKKFASRRSGDLPSYYADSTKAYQELGWKPELGLEEIVKSSYHYAINNKK